MKQFYGVAEFNPPANGDISLATFREYDSQASRARDINEAKRRNRRPLAARVYFLNYNTERQRRTCVERMRRAIARQLVLI